MNNITPSNKQLVEIKKIKEWFYSKNRKSYFYLAGFAGCGKSLSLDSQIQTPNGPILMKDIKVGDVIFGKNGNTTKVVGVFPQGIRPSYKVTFGDGFSVICDEDHLWSVSTKKLAKKDVWETLTTKEIIQNGYMKYLIPICDPVEYSEKNLPIDPYLLGLLIGGGSLTNNSEITLTIRNEDEKILKFIKNMFDGIHVNVRPGCNVVDIPNSSGVKDSIVEFGLNVESEKQFIPDIYLTGSIAQRKKLLNGLMDSDGSTYKNKNGNTAIPKRLAENISNLVQSLGGIAVLHERKMDDGSVEYNLNVKTKFNPFLNKHHPHLWNYANRNPPSRYIKSIEKVEDVEMQCISVDAEDRLYLTDHYIVTHNTSIAKHIVAELGIKVVYAAYTGKAALVMKKNGCEGAQTIHSLIYIPVVNKQTGEVTFKLNHESAITDVDLIVVDECSMVDEKMGSDLLSFGVPLLVLGDPAQLPPVNGAGYFTNGTPDGFLTEIHRQAADNPIIYLATRVRNGDTLDVGNFGNSKVTNKFLKNEVYTSDQFICGLNKTRVAMNEKFRKFHGFEGVYPKMGEKLICLRNDYDKGLLNGEMLENRVDVIEDAKTKHTVKMIVNSMDNEDGNDVTVDALKYHFDSKIPEPTWKEKSKKNEITYGYALTCHKTQGSQFPTVFIYDESSYFRDKWTNWLYTAITRASENVIICV